MQEVKELEKELDVLKNKLFNLEFNSKTNLEKMKKDAKDYKNKINLIDDDIYEMQSWIKKKFPAIEEKQMKQMFQIPEDFESKLDKLEN